MWNKIKKTFFTRSFITFCLIGFIAYLVHQGVYSLYTQVFVFWDDSYRLTSTAIAFSISSIIAYILNARFTYSKKMTTDRTIKAILTYVAKFALTESITLGIMALANHFLNSTDLLYNIIDLGLPVLLTAITLVLQFLIFNLIFKKDDDERKETQEQS